MPTHDKQQSELAALNAKIARGERLTNDERLRRQGLLFNHGGRCIGPLVTNRQRAPRLANNCGLPPKGRRAP